MIPDCLVRNRLHKFRSSSDNTTLTVNAFLQARHRRPKVFLSQIEDTQTQWSAEDPTINFQVLINKSYDARAFRRMMKLYLGMDKIILEEKATHEIAQEVRHHPQKCFSHRSTDSNPARPTDPADDLHPSNVSVLNTTQVTMTDLPSFQQVSTQRLDSVPSGAEPSEKSLDMMELSKLSDVEIKEIVQRKMKKLDRFNLLLEKKRLNAQGLTELLTQKHLRAIEWFQKRCRGFLMRRKFFLALRMNDMFEQKKNYMALKKSLKAYQDFVGKGGRSGMFESAFDSGLRG